MENFKKYLRLVLDEQLQSLNRAAAIGVVDKGEKGDAIQVDRPVDTDTDVDSNDDLPDGIPLPDGFQWDADCNGGEGCWIDADGNLYTLEYVVYIDSAGDPVVGWMPVTTIGGQTVVFSNGFFQLAGTNSTGQLYVMPNVWVFVTPGGGTAFFTQIGNTFFMTYGDPTQSDVVWINLMNGSEWSNNSQGNTIDYPEWAIQFGFQFDVGGQPIGGELPLLPGGGSFNPIIGPYSDPDVVGGGGAGESSIWLGFQAPIPWTPDEGTLAQDLQFRLYWNTFVQWYMENNPGADGVPEQFWPTGASWWDRYVESNPGGNNWYH